MASKKRKLIEGLMPSKKKDFTSYDTPKVKKTLEDMRKPPSKRSVDATGTPVKKTRRGTKTRSDLVGPKGVKPLPIGTIAPQTIGAGSLAAGTLLALTTDKPGSKANGKKPDSWLRKVKKAIEPPTSKVPPKRKQKIKKPVKGSKFVSEKTKRVTAVPVKKANGKISPQIREPVKGRKWAGKYKVKSGDSLSKIAKRMGVSLKSLLTANPKFKEDPNLIKVGQNVAVPEAKIKGTGISIYKGVSKSTMAKMAKKTKKRKKDIDKKPIATSFTKFLPDREVGTPSLPPALKKKAPLIKASKKPFKERPKGWVSKTAKNLPSIEVGPQKLEPRYSTLSKPTKYKNPKNPEEAQRLLNKIEKMSQKQIDSLGVLKYKKMLKTIRDLQKASKGGKVMKKQAGGGMTRVGLSPAEMARAGVMSEARRRRYVKGGGKVGKKKGGTVNRKHGGQIGTSFVAAQYAPKV